MMGVNFENGEADHAQRRDLSLEAGQGSPFVPRSAAARRCETAGRNEVIPSSQSKFFMKCKKPFSRGVLNRSRGLFWLKY